jgi:hypothetical protein
MPHYLQPGSRVGTVPGGLLCLTLAARPATVRAVLANHDHSRAALGAHLQAMITEEVEKQQGLHPERELR